MAKQQRKELGAGSRFMLWVRQNEKVLFVLLLGAIGFTFAFGDVIRQVMQRTGGSRYLGFGRSIGVEEFQVQLEIYPKVIAFGRPVLLTDDAVTLQAVDGGFNVRELLIYRGVALDLGIRVSDEELDTEIKRLWRRYAASAAAAESLQNQGLVPRNANDFQYAFRFQPEVEKNERFLEEKDTFDPENYADLVRSQTGLRVKVFEKTLRDLLLIKRLGQYVASTVALDPEDVYKEFRSERQRRKLRWLEVEVPDELRNKLAGTISDADIRQQYNENRRASRTGARLKFRWLRGNREAFLAEVEKGASDEKLKEFYDEDRRNFLAPGLFPNAAGFALLTSEQKEARDAERYKPFDDVKEEVQRRYVRSESNSLLKDLSSKLRLQLYPSTPKAGSKEPLPPPAVEFEKLAEELSSVTAGETDFATREEAEDTFGPLYSGSLRSKIDRWFQDAEKGGSSELSDANQRSLRFASNFVDAIDDDPDPDLRTNEFFVFFTDVEIRGPGIPSLEDMRDRIVEKIVNRKLNDLVAEAIDDRVGQINEGSAEFGAQVGSTLDITLESGEEFQAELGEIEDSGQLYVARSYGGVMVPKPRDGEEATTDEAKEDEAKEDDEKEVEHDSSAALRTGVFALAAPGEVGLARDDENGFSYIVEFVDRVYPDPGDFETARAYTERELARKRREVVFSQWRDKVYLDGGIELSTARDVDEGDGTSS